MKEFYLGQRKYETQKVCFKTEVENCLLFKDLETCKECTENYFLNEQGECQIYPEQSIDNCIIYCSENHCCECKNGFFLDHNACQPVIEIEKCIKYDGKSHENKC